MSRPSVSVIIPCYNHGAFIRDAIASVEGGHQIEIEIIIVDDGSTDAATVRQMELLKQEGYHVIRQSNQGLATARNVGIGAAQADYILPLDADNQVCHEYFHRGLAVLEQNPEIGVVYGDAEYFGERAGRWRVGPFSERRLLIWNYIDACALYRKEVWARNGGYDAKMPVQGLEDWDFWLSALENRWKFWYAPEVLFKYRVRGDSMITQTGPYWQEIGDYIARKHGVLYRKAWLEKENASPKHWPRRLFGLARRTAGRGRRALRRCFGQTLSQSEPQ